MPPSACWKRLDIFAVLVGSLLLSAWCLPLLLYAREVARETGCAAHLQKIARSCLGYAETHNKTLPSNRRQPYTSWNTLVLPYLDRQSLYDRYDMSQDWWKEKNQAAGAERLPELLCPAAPHAERTVRLLDPKGQEFRAAPTDYAASAGVYLFRNQPEQLFRGAMASPGRFYGGSQIRAGRAVKLSEVTDGASNSLLIVEMAGRPNVWRAGKLHEDRTHDDPRPLVEGFSFGQWSAPNWSHLRSYNSAGTTPFGDCAVNGANQGSIYGFHRGFANASFVDGSVRPLRAGLPEEVLAALVSIADGERITPADYQSE